MRTIEVPGFPDVFPRLMEYSVSFDSERASIAEWLQRYRREVPENRGRSPLEIFRIFACALLERRVSGGNHTKRRKAMDLHVSDFADVNPDIIHTVLRESGYPWKKQGINTVMRLKAYCTETGFLWEDYFKTAESRWEDDFIDDEMLHWKFVGRKVRDLALSEFCLHFCAVDTRLTNVLCRTGLICQGFGDPDISNGPSYGFCRNLLKDAACNTGWPVNPSGLSLGEIDRMFWFFAQERCTATPQCRGCPLTDICCTGRLSRTDA